MELINQEIISSEDILKGHKSKMAKSILLYDKLYFLEFIM